MRNMKWNRIETSAQYNSHNKMSNNNKIHSETSNINKSYTLLQGQKIDLKNDS